MPTSLIKKLGIKPGYTIWLRDTPAHYFDLLEELPDPLTVVEEPSAESVDFIHLFCQTQEQLQDAAPGCKEALKKDGLLWVSWPKKTSKMPSDLHREWVRHYLLDLGLVDVKVAAIDADWSGLKFVYRVADR